MIPGVTQGHPGSVIELTSGVTQGHPGWVIELTSGVTQGHPGSVILGHHRTPADYQRLAE